MKNADAQWDRFDSDSYVRHNYARLSPEDRSIVGWVRDYFAACLDGRAPGGSGIDVGTGPNLTAALCMLPFCQTITALERSATNVTWLEQHIGEFPVPCAEVWTELRAAPGYAGIGDPRGALAERTVVSKGSVFELPPERHDVATMFFVAESMTTDADEFWLALERFVGTLRRDAPFAMAFMENSAGYSVERVDYPAYRVDANDVVGGLEPSTVDLRVHRVDPIEDHRAGYTGMFLVLGRRR